MQWGNRTDAKKSCVDQFVWTATVLTMSEKVQKKIEEYLVDNRPRPTNKSIFVNQVVTGLNQILYWY